MSVINNIYVDTTTDNRVETGQKTHAGVFFFCEVRAQWHQPRHVGAGMAVSSVAKRGNCLLNFLVNTIYTTWSLRFTRSEHMWDWQLSGFYKRFPFTPSSPEHFKMNSEVMSTWRTEDGLVKLVRKWNIFYLLILDFIRKAPSALAIHFWNEAVFLLPSKRFLSTLCSRMCVF